MAASSGSNAASEAYKRAGASAQQVATIQAAERAHQSSTGRGSVSTGANPQTLRDYVNSIGRTLDYQNGTTYMNGNGYANGNIPGTRYDATTGTHYVTDPNAVKGIYGMNNQNIIQQSPDELQEIRDTEKQIIAQPDQFDNTAYIQQLAEAQRRSRISALDKQRTSSLSALDNEKAGISPTYYDKRNQAAAASDVGAMNFANYMAARGIRGAAGAMPEIYRNAGLQGQIGALDRQEASNIAAIESQRANIESGYASDVASANADTESQAMQSQISQWNADRSYALEKAKQDYDIKKGNEERAKSTADTAKQQWITNVGQYSNDYAAEINKVENDGDTSNDWQIPYLQKARNEKLAAQQKAATEAAQQEIDNQQEWARINKPKSSGGSKPSTSINQQYTQQVIAQLLKHNATGRANLFNQYASYWAENGVDIAKVQSAAGLSDD